MSLIKAITESNLEIATWLLENGADPNEQTPGDEMSALMVASERGIIDAVELLLKFGAKPELQNRGGMTALIYASDRGNFNTVTKLLEAGADVDLKDERGCTAINYAHRGNHRGIVKLLEERIAEIIKEKNEVELSKKEPETGSLLDAVKTGNVEIVKFVLRNDAIYNINETSNSRWTPLILAASNTFTEIVELLIDAGSAIDLQTLDGNTALMIACMNGRTENVKILLEAGAETNIQNKNGKNACNVADGRYYNAIVGLLQNFGNENTKVETPSKKAKLNPVIQAAIDNLVDAIANEMN